MFSINFSFPQPTKCTISIFMLWEGQLDKYTKATQWWNHYWINKPLLCQLGAWCSSSDFDLRVLGHVVFLVWAAVASVATIVSSVGSLMAWLCLEAHLWIVELYVFFTGLCVWVWGHRVLCNMCCFDVLIVLQLSLEISQSLTTNIWLKLNSVPRKH